MNSEVISGIIEFNPGGETMLAKIAALGLENWTIEERQELLDVVMDSLPGEEEELDIPDWHREEIERRIREDDANPQPGKPWREVMARFEAIP